MQWPFSSSKPWPQKHKRVYSLIQYTLSYLLTKTCSHIDTHILKLKHAHTYLYLLYMKEQILNKVACVELKEQRKHLLLSLALLKN
ncbi:hypothetical protein FKM82_008632 [Ascaphus truei]